MMMMMLIPLFSSRDFGKHGGDAVWSSRRKANGARNLLHTLRCPDCGIINLNLCAKSILTNAYTAFVAVSSLRKEEV